MSKYPKQGLSDMTPDNLNWLNGSWKGQQGENQFEEYWSPLGGGTLMAMFRWLKKHQVWFYEFITVEQAGDNVMMRIKHFYPGMQGWEAKDEALDFLLVQLQNRSAPNTARTRPPAKWAGARGGTRPVFTYACGKVQASIFLGLKLVPPKWHYLIPPQAATAGRWGLVPARDEPAKT